jgi:hypothetical protein
VIALFSAMRAALLQHRRRAIAAGALLIPLAAIAILLGAQMGRDYAELQQLVSLGNLNAAESLRYSALLREYPTIRDGLIFGSALVPVAFAAVFVAVGFSTEIRARTLVMAWSQGASRQRWLASQLGTLAFLGCLGTGIVTLALAVSFAPLRPTSGWFISYDAVGIVPFAYLIFALSLAGALAFAVRRPLSSAALAVIIFGAVRYAFRLLRLKVLPTQTYDTLTGVAVRNAPPSFGRGVTVDVQCISHGGGVSDQQFVCAPGTITRYLFQPADHFLPIQVIESGVFLVLAGVLIAVIVWQLHRIELTR